MSIKSLLLKTTQIQIPMRSISGFDPELKSFMRDANFCPGLSLDPDEWRQGSMEALYFHHPLLVVERGGSRKSHEEASDSNKSSATTSLDNDGPVQGKSTECEQRVGVYQVVGSVLSLPLAEELYRPDDLVPVRCIQAGRIARGDKLELLAAELLGIPVLHGRGKGAPRIGEHLWETLMKFGVNPLQGERVSDYKSATHSTYR